jgi:methylmalonyl-CoA mutase
MEDLFREFKACTAAEWKSRIEKDLKGEDYSSLIWRNDNGFDVQPFYNAEHLSQDYTPAFQHTDWEIGVRSENKAMAEDLNKYFLERLKAGATSITCNIGDNDPAVLLKDIELNFIRSVFFVGETNSQKLIKYLQEKYPGGINCCIFPDRFETTADLDLVKSISVGTSTMPGTSTLCIDALKFHNLNCTASYEIAVIFSMLVEVLENLGGHEIPITPIAIRCGVNSDYFIQIAKLRAIRRLWEIFKNEYKITNDIYILVETSVTNKSISDSYNNLLRTTVEAMAAVAGGCNELVVLPFDHLFPVNRVLSERMAVNQQLILKDESYLDKMADIGCGSFYIETITDNIAKKALEIFKEFEKKGGYFSCLKNGIFQNDISAQNAKPQEKINNGQQIVVGINKFRNEKEKIDISGLERHYDQFNNPVLNYELEHFFKLKNA